MSVFNLAVQINRQIGNITLSKTVTEFSPAAGSGNNGILGAIITFLNLQMGLERKLKPLIGSLVDSKATKWPGFSTNHGLCCE